MNQARAQKIKKEHLLFGIVFLLLVVIIVLLFRRESNETGETDREVADQEIGGAIREGTQKEREASEEVQTGITDGIKGAIGDVLREGASLPKNIPIPSGDSLPEVRPKEIVSDMFKFGQDVLKKGDELGQQMLVLDLEEENLWGTRLHEQILAEKTPVADEELLKRVEQLAEPLLEHRRRKTIDYTFTILDDPEINAFSLAGGYVYVNKGLMDFTKGDVELQYVLGHEIAHVDLRHCAKNVTYYARASEIATPIAGNLASGAYRLVSSGYTKEHEFEADEWGLRMLTKIGRARDEVLSFPRRLRDHFIAQGIDVEEVKPPLTIFDVMNREISNHFETHPPNKERIERLEELSLDKVDAAASGADTANDDESFVWSKNLGATGFASALHTIQIGTALAEPVAHNPKNKP